MASRGRHPQAQPTSRASCSFLTLHLVITLHGLSISRWRGRAAAPRIPTIFGLVVWFVRRSRRLLALRVDCAISALGGVLNRLVRDVVIGNIAVLQIATSTPATGDGLVGYIVIVWFRMLEDDVPCVDETREEAE